MRSASVRYRTWGWLDFGTRSAARKIVLFPSVTSSLDCGGPRYRGVRARCHAKYSLENSVKVTLIDETSGGGSFRNGCANGQQLLCLLDPDLAQIGMRRHADRAPESS